MQSKYSSESKIIVGSFREVTTETGKNWSGNDPDFAKKFGLTLEFFWSRIGHPLFGLIKQFLAFFELRIKNEALV